MLFYMAISSLKPIELFFRRAFLWGLALVGQGRKGQKGRKGLGELTFSESPSILILRQDRLGDVMMSTFLIGALREKYPHSRIGILLGKNNAAVFPLLPFDCEKYLYSKNIIADIKELRRIRDQEFDVVIDMTDKASVTSSILLAFIGAKINIGIAKENDVMYDIVVPRPSQTEVHITERVAELLRPFGIDPALVDKRPRLNITAKRLKGRVGLNVSSRTPDRSAPSQASAEIAHGALALGFSEVVVFSAPHDRIRGEETVLRTKDPRIHEAPRVKDLTEFANQIASCEYLITVDTSVIQIAASVGIPMVLLFRPMSDEHPWTPVGVPFEIYTQYPGLSALEPQPVLALFEKLISRQNVKDRQPSNN
jgi:ADP-heptose:LPS heptosyltransferase